jgi:TolB-like protein
MKKCLALLVLSAIFCAGAAAKDNLAVLPFSGGAAGEGETIAELFSFNQELNLVFSPILRTSIAKAIDSEQKFQTATGMTDPDTIAAIGRQLGANYVVAGNIAKLGRRNLLIISILKIDELRQIAGDIQTYAKIEEIQGKLPDMARNIIAAARADTAGLEKLAVVPVSMGGDVDSRVADTLAQILSINLIRSGKYAVYPRTATLEQVETEYKNQLSGITADKNMVSIGRGDNPRLVLSVAARRLGSQNMFNASIINLESGVGEGPGGSVNYTTLDDGITAMESLTQELTGVNIKGVTPGIPPLGYGFMNLALGLGSFVQGDLTGGLTLAGGYAASLGLIIWEMTLSRGDAGAGIPGGIGLGIMGLTAAYGFVRPYLYDRSGAFAGITDRVQIAVFPGERDATAVRLSYTLRF